MTVTSAPLETSLLPTSKMKTSIPPMTGGQDFAPARQMCIVPLPSSRYFCITFVVRRFLSLLCLLILFETALNCGLGGAWMEYLPGSIRPGWSRASIYLEFYAMIYEPQSLICEPGAMWNGHVLEYRTTRLLSWAKEKDFA